MPCPIIERVGTGGRGMGSQEGAVQPHATAFFLLPFAVRGCDPPERRHPLQPSDQARGGIHEALPLEGTADGAEELRQRATLPRRLVQGPQEQWHLG